MAGAINKTRLPPGGAWEHVEPAEAQATPEPEEVKMGPKIRFAVNASFGVNFCLFCIQLYAAVSTGSLSVWCTMVVSPTADFS